MKKKRKYSSNLVPIHIKQAPVRIQTYSSPMLMFDIPLNNVNDNASRYHCITLRVIVASRSSYVFGIFSFYHAILPTACKKLQEVSYHSHFNALIMRFVTTTTCFITHFASVALVVFLLLLFSALPFFRQQTAFHVLKYF